MEKWIEIAVEKGTLGLFLLLVLWFLYKKLWPIIERRLTDADVREEKHQDRWEEQGKMFASSLEKHREADERRFAEQSRLFTEALRTQNVFASETHKETMAAHNRLADKLEVMDQRLKNGNGK